MMGSTMAQMMVRYWAEMMVVTMAQTMARTTVEQI